MSTEECSGECAHEQPNMEPELSYNEAGEEDDKNKEEGPNIGKLGEGHKLNMLLSI